MTANNSRCHDPDVPYQTVLRLAAVVLGISPQSVNGYLESVHGAFKIEAADKSWRIVDKQDNTVAEAADTLDLLCDLKDYIASLR